MRREVCARFACDFVYSCNCVRMSLFTQEQGSVSVPESLCPLTCVGTYLRVYIRVCMNVCI